MFLSHPKHCKRCKACEAAYMRRRYQADPARHRGYARTYREKHPLKVKEMWAMWSATRRAELANKRSDRLKKEPEKNRAYVARRRATEKRAMPIWADLDQMLAFYAEATRLTRETGIVHHVDHIYPLKSEIMCGLHCQTNLQVVPATVNQRKRNLPPTMDEEPRCCAWPSIIHFESFYGVAA